VDFIDEGTGFASKAHMSLPLFDIEFIGGSRDGEVIESTHTPTYFEVPTGREMKEIYRRQNEEPPFIYVQIGYAGNETWK